MYIQPSRKTVASMFIYHKKYQTELQLGVRCDTYIAIAHYSCMYDNIIAIRQAPALLFRNLSL